MIDSKFWKTIFFVSIYLISTIGVLVIGAWYLKIDNILQVSPNFAPVQFNAALCFFLSGISLLFIFYKKYNYLKFFGIILFLIPFLTLIQYVFDLNFGIDQIFVNSHILEKTSHPGRMAPNAAFSFLLFSVYILLYFKGKKYTQWSSVLGSILFGFGMVALVGYLVGVESTYAWGKYTNMAIITAIGFVLLGASSSIYSIFNILAEESTETDKIQLWIFGYTITAAIMILLIDTQLPNSIATGVLFALLIPFGWLLPKPKSSLYLALIATALCLLNLFFNLQDADLLISSVNRIFSIIIIWSFAILLFYVKKNKFKLFSLNNLLNNKIVETELKNEELEQFLYTVTHDLKEPLRSVSVLLDILDTKEPQIEEEERKHLTYLIKSSATRMGVSIQAILNFAKLGQSFTSEIIDLNLLLKDVLFDLSHIISSNKVEINIEHLPTLKIYEEDFRKLLQNLISNAIKYTDANKLCKINISAKEEDKFYRFFVKDNGVGIDKINHIRIFKIFQRLQKNDDGLGIGLAHCQKIVNLHKGEIYVESALGEGSTFIFTVSKKL